MQTVESMIRRAIWSVPEGTQVDGRQLVSQSTFDRACGLLTAGVDHPPRSTSGKLREQVQGLSGIAPTWTRN
ncbi:uncharacterized protein BP01DRAFT_359927 [Aspergillus saccharolyticus JOP 1030-1]|uniref:Uncharacterized protein n=1 Tax=Aspergillus saccharolyticus JOP 1030-1 TaxID=1450539 RepID=A0A318Z4I4_9EURO|nr:hypothetical protein BP01DRAFT_359927 [Aspergillus saccharolyticus JOP 1030-1]PYH41949.1 hypothetical protein BP01DRAFT_359927 [Aspergillus saccharolyticus JOP 1030-1]